MDLKVLSKEHDRMKIEIIMKPGDREVISTTLNLSGVFIQFRMIFMEVKNVKEIHFGTMFHHFILFFKFSRKDKSEKYICTVDIGSKIYHCNDDDSWAHILETKTNSNVNRTVTIVVNTVPLQSPFSVLYEDTELTDFELRGEDGSSVQVHSFVLAASSPVLRAMLGKQYKETEDRSCYIKDATQTTLQHLKDFMYTKAIPKTGFEELLKLSHCYMMPELEKVCTERLLDSVNATNVMELNKFAVVHGFQKFSLAILRRIQTGQVNLEDVELP